MDSVGLPLGQGHQPVQMGVLILKLARALANKPGQKSSIFAPAALMKASSLCLTCNSITMQDLRVLGEETFPSTFLGSFAGQIN